MAMMLDVSRDAMKAATMSRNSGDPAAADPAAPSPSPVYCSTPTTTKGTAGTSTAIANQIVEFTLIVWYSGRHLIVESFHRHDLDADIDFVADEKCHVFDKEIKRNESILAELNLDGNAIFDEIRLIVRINWRQASRLNLLLLFS